MLASIGAVLILGHVIADRFDGPESDRWLYYTRSGLQAVAALAIAVWIRRFESRILPQLFIVIMLWVLVDLSFHFVRGRPAIEHKRFQLPEMGAGHPGILLGELPYANQVHHDVKIKDGDTIYKAAYTIDEHFRRFTPGRDSTAHKHALFFGCSVCFGQWMHDDSTLAARFLAQTDGFNAYNYSFPGWGTGQMVARLESFDLRAQVPEAEGLGVYVFIWPHINRAVGDMHTYCGWGHQHPYYELIDGLAVRNKRFKDGRPVTSTFYELAWRSNIIRYSKVNFPLSFNEDHLKLHVAMVLKAKQEYLRQFPKGRFVVLWAQDWPSPKHEALQHRYVTMLHEAGIDFIDGRRPLLMDNRYALKDDAHPTALAYDDMAKMLIHGLDSLGWRTDAHR